jgi:hypothetical protein
MHNEDMLWVYLAPAFGGMITMIICGAIAKSWLTKNEGYQQSRAANFFLGPLLTSFGPVKRYREARAQRGESTAVATIFYVGTACWALGLIMFFVWISQNAH